MSDRTDMVERMRDNEKIQAESIEELLEAIDADEEQTLVLDSKGEEGSAESSVELSFEEANQIFCEAPNHGPQDDGYGLYSYTCPECGFQIVQQLGDPHHNGGIVCAECRVEMEWTNHFQGFGDN